MKAFNKIIFMFIISGWLLLYSIDTFNNDYNSYTDFEVTAIDKLQSYGSNKSSGNFYVVYKLNKDYNFDLKNYSIPKDYKFDVIVGAAYYSQLEIGKTYIVNTRPMDIKSDGWLSVSIFFMIVCFIVSMVGFWEVATDIYKLIKGKKENGKQN